MNRSLLLAASVLALASPIAWAQTVTKTAVRNGDVEVPVEIARPDGAGPFPPVLFIHARRGYVEEEQQTVRALAKQGFLVVAPDWQTGRLLERWPVPHDPATEGDVEAAFELLRKHPDACRIPAGVVGVSRGGYYAIRLAVKRPQDVAAISSWYGHMQNPNAPEPQQIYSVAPEIAKLTTPILLMIGENDFEVRRLSNGRAFYALYERGVPVEMQIYPMARRAFDFRRDQTPEEKVAVRHAREKERAWLGRWMKLTPELRCP